jgi:hypothetical protein
MPNIFIELRIAVYEYCVGPSHRKLKHKRLRCIPHDRFRASLNQVCRQIRVEFLPMYLGSAVQVPAADATALVDVFLPPSQERKDPIRIFVDITRRRGIGPLDLLPVLLCVLFRDDIILRLHCIGAGTIIAHALDKALRRYKQQWRPLLSEVSNIYVWPHRHTLKPFQPALTIAIVGSLSSWCAKRDIETENVWTDLGLGGRRKIRLSLVDNFGSYGLGRGILR